MGVVTWYKLQASDIPHYDAEAKALVMRAMELGGVARLSSKGHVIVRSPGGQTMSVPRKLSRANRSMQNAVNGFAKAFDLTATEAAPGGPKPKKARRLEALPGPEDAVQFAEREDGTVILCPVEECPYTAVTAGGMYEHTHSAHPVCREPGCDYIAKSNAGRAAHERHAHGGVKPREGTGKKAGAVAAMLTITAAIPDDLLAEDPRVKDLHESIAALRAEVAELSARLEHRAAVPKPGPRRSAQ